MPQTRTLAARGDSANYKVLYSFAGGSDGAEPYAGLLNVGNVLYGTTAEGGAYNNCNNSNEGPGCGTVFSVTLSGTEKVLHSFAGGSNGRGARAGLIDVRGTLYGTTFGKGGYGNSGGCYYSTYYCGMVFSITPRGKEKVLHGFQGGYSDGAFPYAGLIDVKGTLYGTTWSGEYVCVLYYYGGCGAVFSVKLGGAEKVLRVFHGKPNDGSRPLAGLIEVNGTLYGTTYGGGDYKCRCGTVFSITPNGKEKVLHSFRGGSDGAYPRASLIDVNGTLYGTTVGGGAYSCPYGSCGTVFSITPGGKEKVLHSFDGTDGDHPQASLINVKGTLYGTTSHGGAYTCHGSYDSGCGTVFSITLRGKEKVLHSFGNGADGSIPYAGLRRGRHLVWDYHIRRHHVSVSVPRLCCLCRLRNDLRDNTNVRSQPIKNRRPSARYVKHAPEPNLANRRSRPVGVTHMKAFGFGPHGLGICAVSLLVGCGGLQVPIGAPSSQSPVATHDKKHSKTFGYTGGEQTFTIPTGVTHVTVTASGASGAPSNPSSSFPGAGGLIVATIAVRPGHMLAIFVGGEGRGSSGGYNGGGNGAGNGSNAAPGGGGASDVRQGGDGLGNRVVVAGGGGGQGQAYTAESSAGGAGGGRKGVHGLPLTQVGLNAAGGLGGAQRGGGIGGAGGVGTYCDGKSGTRGYPDAGGSGGSGCFMGEGEGGGGGGGFQGGGGGGGAGASPSKTGYADVGSSGGGGGGSSHAEATATNVTDRAGGAPLGNGQVIISWR